ncbi:MAG: DegT/DnrJ/EryC1/StrS family aminotransferase [candidate division WOR-3 bacterium]
MKSVLSVLESRWISVGPRTEEFEEALKRYFGVDHALFVSSGTASLHIAYISAGLTKERKVILPSFTYISTLTPLIWMGVPFVFADIESISNPKITPSTIEEVLDDNVNAVIYMAYAGFLNGIEEVRDYCESRGLILIEDASHCHGSELKGKKAGNFGVVAGMSFYANKNITTGEGGVVLTNSENVYRKAKALRSQGITSSSFERYRGLELDYDILEIGYTYRATELQAALGISQLRKLDRLNLRRKKLVRLYRELLKDVEEVIIPFEDFNSSANYIFPIFTKVDRDSLRLYLYERGIQTSIHYKPLHMFSAVKKYCGDAKLPVTEQAYKMQITLPLFPSMTEGDVEFIVESIKDGIAKIKSN